MARTGAPRSRPVLREAGLHGSGRRMDATARPPSGTSRDAIGGVERDLLSGKSRGAFSRVRRARRKASGNRLLAASLLRAVARHPRRAPRHDRRCVRHAGDEMSEAFDLLIRGGICVTPSGIASADVGIRSGRIAAIGALSHASASEMFEAQGLHVLPGIIDTHVHFREPGDLEKEDMKTGSRAAVLGGVTAVFDMPNTNPPTTARLHVEDKLRRAAARMYCDHAFYVGASPENIGDLAQLEQLPGVAGVKAFLGSSTGSLLLDKEDDILAALRGGRRRLAVHSEDEARLRARAKLAMPGDPRTHPVWRDVETARISTERVLRLARSAGRRLHVLHVTTAEELPLIAAARDIATLEAAVPHLTLAAPECYERLGAYAQINPPIRDARHREALWQAMAEGLIDVVGSDHAPHCHADKSGIYPQTAS